MTCTRPEGIPPHRHLEKFSQIFRAYGKTPEVSAPKTLPFESIQLTWKVVHIQFRPESFAPWPVVFSLE